MSILLCINDGWNILKYLNISVLNNSNVKNKNENLYFTLSNWYI